MHIKLFLILVSQQVNVRSQMNALQVVSLIQVQMLMLIMLFVSQHHHLVQAMEGVRTLQEKMRINMFVQQIHQNQYGKTTSPLILKITINIMVIKKPVLVVFIQGFYKQTVQPPMILEQDHGIVQLHLVQKMLFQYWMLVDQ